MSTISWRRRRPTRRSPGTFARRWLAAAAIILIPLLAPAMDAPQPAAYAASYRVKVYGLRGSLDVEQTRVEAGSDAPDGGDAPTADQAVPRAAADADAADAAGTPAPAARQRWRIRSELDAKGIANLFVRGQTVEDSLFELGDDGRVRPVTVSVHDDIGDKPREVTFAWPAREAGDVGLAEGSDSGETFSLNVPHGVLDRSLLVPAIALELARAQGARDADGNPVLSGIPYDPERGYLFRVLERGKVRDYHARPLGEEQVEGPDGEPVDTLVLEHQRDGSSRATTFWVAPSLGYLPVRIEQRKDDRKPHLRAELEKYRWLDDTAESLARASDDAD